MADGCYHCGDDVIGRGYSVEEKQFCCNGCVSVYKLLQQNGLSSFYDLESEAGTRPSEVDLHKYDFLEVQEIKARFIGFEDENSIHVTLFLPTIHCSSCIYLLENLTKIEPAIYNCQTNFTKKEATIVFDKTQFSLSQLATLLDRIGYAPNFGERVESGSGINKGLLYKLGVAGFAFGSIMLWSFPEYLGVGTMDIGVRNFTSYLSFFISLPVLLFSANEYYISAFKALRSKSITIDVPISLGIFALYAQSSFHIFTGSGPGYMDSFSGFIFFLLIGKWFQEKTYQSLSFEHDHKAYFPVAIIRLIGEREEIVEIEKLKEGDDILIRNNEIIPCDAVLKSASVQIDYSFVTGESLPKEVKQGELVYAGGRLVGQRTHFNVKKSPKRSRLIQLWNAAGSAKKETIREDKLAVYFLLIVLCIALGTGVFWWIVDSSIMVKTVVSVLIVACPCALALSRPFTFGNTMRNLGRKGLYLKNVGVVSKINAVNDIVFDKTGTLTKGSYEHVRYEGENLSTRDMQQVMTLVKSSTHPLSKAILMSLVEVCDFVESDVENFTEIPGRGLSGIVDGISLKIGAKSFIGFDNQDELETASYLEIGSQFKGKFVFESELRDGVALMLEKIAKTWNVHVLSGDNDKDEQLLRAEVPSLHNLRFNQSPEDKFEYINKLQSEGKKVLMVGDGLNDAGALIAADVGIAISEDVFQFTPSSDAIIEANKLKHLASFLGISIYAKTVLNVCIWFSITYNFVGLWFAVSGHLTPLIAAVLMPLSSITIVVLSTLLVMHKKKR
jgi:Cu+-exporting ATPase